MTVRLIAQVGRLRGSEIAVDGPEFVIGHDPACQLRIEHPYIGRRHCRIVRKGGRILVEDLGTPTGTEVNGQEIRSVEVRDGDRLFVGLEQFVIAVGDEADAPIDEDPDDPVTLHEIPIQDLGIAPGDWGTSSVVGWPNPPRPEPEPAAPPAARGAEAVRLVATEGKNRGRVIEFYEPTFTIGRDPSCQLRPKSELISRFHAAIERRDGKVFVRDEGSTNGTFLNDRRFRGEEVEAADGDRLRVGPLRFVIEVPTAPDPLSLLAPDFELRPEGAEFSAPGLPRFQTLSSDPLDDLRFGEDDGPLPDLSTLDDEPLEASAKFLEGDDEPWLGLDPVAPSGPDDEPPASQEGGTGPGPVALGPDRVHPEPDLQFSTAIQPGSGVRLIAAPAPPPVPAAPIAGHVPPEQLLHALWHLLGRGGFPPAAAAVPPSLPDPTPPVVAEARETPSSLAATIVATRPAAPTPRPPALPTASAALGVRPDLPPGVPPRGSSDGPAISRIREIDELSQDVLLEAFRGEGPRAPGPDPVPKAAGAAPGDSLDDLVLGVLDGLGDEPVPAIEELPSELPQGPPEARPVPTGYASLRKDSLGGADAGRPRPALDRARQRTLPAAASPNPNRSPSRAAPRPRGGTDRVERLFRGWEDLSREKKGALFASLLLFVVLGRAIGFDGLLRESLGTRSQRAVEAAMYNKLDRLAALTSPRTSKHAKDWLRLIGPVLKKQVDDGARTEIKVVSEGSVTAWTTVSVRPASSRGTGPPSASGIPRQVLLFWERGSRGEWLLDGNTTLQSATALLASASAPQAAD